MPPPSSDTTKTNKAKAGGCDRAAGKKKTQRSPPNDGAAAPESLPDGDRLDCGVCLGTVEDAMQTGCCGQPVCRECIALAMAPVRDPSKSCPFCREPGNERNAPVPDRHNHLLAANAIVFAGDRRECSLCLNLVVDAMQMGCCGTSCCRSCIDQALDPRLNTCNACLFCNRSKACPYCGNNHGDAPVRDPHNERMAANTIRICRHAGCGFRAKRDALAVHVSAVHADVCDPPFATLISNLASVSAIAARGGLLPPLHRNDAALRSVRGAVTKLLMTSFAAAASPRDRDALQRRLEANGVYVRTTVGALSDAGGSTDRRSGDGGSPHARFTVQRDPGGGVALRHTDSGAPAADWYIMQVGAPVTGSSVQRVTIPALGQSAVVEGLVAAEDFQGPVAIFAARSRAALVLDDGGVHDEGAGS